MKLMILCVLAFVAVAHSAFTGNLVQQAQPALAQAMFKVRLAASSSRNSKGEIQTQIVSALQDTANSLLSQVQNAVTAGQEIAQQVVSHFSNTIAELQALGQNIYQNGEAILSGFLSNFWSIFGSQRFVGGFIDWVNDFSVTSVLNQVASAATAAVNSLNIASLLELALSYVIPAPIANLIVGQLTSRGFFGDIWTSVSNGASVAWAEISEIASNISHIASSAFANVQQLASDFATQSFAEATAITTEAAQQFLAFLRPYQQDLGVLYEQVLVQVNQIMGN